MTRENIIKYWDAVQAFKDGKKIQSRIIGTEYWEDGESFSFYDENEYRIKPELTKRQPTIEEVEKWFLENMVFILKSSNCMLRITSFTTTPCDSTEEYIFIYDSWYTIEEFCEHFTHYDGSSLYINE